MKKALSIAIFAASILACGSASAAETFKIVEGVTWLLKTPSSTSDAERANAALEACVAQVTSNITVAQQVFEGTNVKVTYRNVAVDKMYGTWSETKNDFFKGGSHKAGGFADCSYYQVIEGI